jgi:CheY-like chemotaxis protein
MPHRQKILVVDDEYDNAFVLKSGLELKGGYNVDAFTDPFTTLNKFNPLFFREIKGRTI